MRKLRREAEEAADRFWFIGALEEMERTDITLSIRLHIRPGLFVQVFRGTKSGSLYLALIEGGRRLYGIDREADEWHVHPYGAVERHEPLPQGLEPEPIHRFLARVEDLLLKYELL
ncbi:MAG: hypothetical protein FJ011_18470 [Chloroflexi bacterium]|nr:hypothetical protein [Chloroflexota bacterium]